jgi:signal transduction histidine kinase/uncharacterized protein HemY
MIAVDYRKLATICDRINQIDKAVSYFDKSIDLSSSIGDEKNEAETLYQLGMFYLRKNRNEVGMQTIEKVLSMARRIGHQKLIANCLGSIGEFHLQYGDTNKAVEVITQSLEICCQIVTSQYLETGLCRLGMAQMKTGEYDKAEASLLEALEMSKQLEDKYSTAFDLMILGDINRERKKYMEAGVYYEQSVERCLELQNYNMLSVIYDKLYQIHRNNNPALSLEWLEKGILVDDSLYNLEMHNQISAFQIKYETEKKEMQITTLENEKKMITWLSIAGASVLFLGLATLFFLWRWTVQKKRLAEDEKELAEQEKQLAEQRIKQLVQEKQLIATQAVLDGEVQERTRLARDLHDGLGSILSAAKYSLVDIRKSFVMESAEAERFDKSIGLLDDSMREMRRVAHHLMPESLGAYGLKQSIADFCNTVPIVNFTWYGDNMRLNPKLEVMIYRIIHELVNNALKHSGASHILVEIVQDADRIFLTVQDNGCGFDQHAQTEGMGLKNISARVAACNGNVAIHSITGEGTEIDVKFPIMN